VNVNCFRTYYIRPDGEVGVGRKDFSASGRAAFT
jgi:hypothetical protein